MKDRIISSILIGFLFAAFLAGCSLFQKDAGSDPFSGMTIATLAGTLERSTSVAFQEPTRKPTVDHGPFILMLDDFSDRNSGWEESESEYGQVGYEGDGYLVQAFMEDQYYWGVAGQMYGDVRIEVDVDVLDTNPLKDDGYGVDCRIQDNGDGYGFRISSDGYAAIILYADNEEVLLLDWEPNSAVYQDGQTNHLTAICQGDHFSFLVNDVEVGEVVDDTYSEGDLALSAISFEADPVSVLFDDIVVQQLGNPYEYEDQNTYNLTIDNPTEKIASSVYVVPAEETFWGDNLLSEGFYIPPGQDVSFDWLTDNPVDIKVETSEHLVLYEQYNVDLETTHSISLIEPKLILHQDFSELGDWPWGVVDGGMISQINNDYYSVSVTEGDKVVAIGNGEIYRDVMILSDTSLARKGQSGMGIYGVACRLQPDGSGIFFGIRGDGMTSIMKIKDGGLYPLTDWQPSDWVNPGIASNYIEADCVGTTFKMFVNGDFLNSVEDNEFLKGGVGVAVYSPVGSTTQADFDYIDVYVGK